MLITTAKERNIDFHASSTSISNSTPDPSKSLFLPLFWYFARRAARKIQKPMKNKAAKMTTSIRPLWDGSLNCTPVSSSINSDERASTKLLVWLSFNAECKFTMPVKMIAILTIILYSKLHYL